uniref:PH domain-containing protein n=1 Tax=Anopheles farauti TaxID=69004 RepID=A0A182Q3C9_9DIPT
MDLIHLEEDEARSILTPHCRTGAMEFHFVRGLQAKPLCYASHQPSYVHMSPRGFFEWEIVYSSNRSARQTSSSVWSPGPGEGRYFILTRDYLNCFKRATGSASEKISDMGQFIFKIKLVDVEKVEWLNRRSYSAIGLLLGSREGRVLLRSDQGLEDWFELLEECTLSSKERRRALRLTQGPRSRASLAAPVSAASLQNNHLGLGGTYSGAIEDWLMSRHQKPGSQRFNHILLSDSVPDLSSINENGLCSGLLTNHSTPKKVPNARHNLSGSSNGYSSSHNGSLYNGFPYSPLKKLADNFVNGNHSYTLHDDLEEEVELRRGGRYRENDDLYRRPLGPGGNDSSRHSYLTDLDYAGCDSGLDTPPSTHRPSSCRDNIYFASAYGNNHAHGSGFLGKDKTTDTGISSSRGTLVSPASSIRHGYVNVQNFNGNSANNNHLNSYGSRSFLLRLSAGATNPPMDQQHTEPEAHPVPGNSTDQSFSSDCGLFSEANTSITQLNTEIDLVGNLVSLSVAPCVR